MRYLVIVFALLLGGCGASKEVRTLVAMGGSGSDTVVVVDKLTKAVVMKICLPELDSECNSVEVDHNGSVLFSYRRGAQLVSRYGDIIWDIVRDNDTDEIQTASIINDGYMLGICGTPSKIYELDKSGNKRKIVRFDTGLERPHSQFRQVKKAKNGNYLIPLMGKSELLEIDSVGAVVARLPVGGFSVVELNDGNLMVATGKEIVVVDRKSGDVIKSIIAPKGSFYTEVNVLNNGNLMLSNWQGYRSKDTDLEWMAAELDAAGNVVWEYKDNSCVKNVSALHQFEGVVEAQKE